MRLFLAATFISILALQVFTSLSVSAASATFSLSPDTIEAHPTEEVVLKITINAGGGLITAAQSCIEYDATKLDFVGVDYTDAPLDWFTPQEASTDCPAGQIQSGRFSPDKKPSGTFILGRIKFKAKTQLGDTTISFGTKSFIFDDQASSTSGPSGSLTGTTPGKVVIKAAPVVEQQAEQKKVAAVVAPPVTPAITDSNREVAQATSADVQLPVVASTPGAAVKEVKSSKKTLFVLIGATVAAILSAIVMAKFLGVPGIPHRSVTDTGFTPPTPDPAPLTSDSNNVSTVTPLPPSAPIDTTPAATIARLPDAPIPGPATVIQPTEHHEEDR